MNRLVLAAAAASALLAAAPLAGGLRPETAAGYQRYLKVAEARRGRGAFLWIDRQPPKVQQKLYAQLRAGEVVVSHVDIVSDDGARIEAPNGLIHDWIGTILIPGVTLARTMTLIEDYARYAEWFGPTIQRSTVNSRSADHFDVSMRMYAKHLITVVLDANYTIDYHRVDAAHVRTRSEATRISEIDDPGTPQERVKTPEEMTGFLWRLTNLCAFEERPEGTIEECESVSLTRDIPFALKWLIQPFVSGVPRETLESSLRRVRTLLTGK